MCTNKHYIKPWASNFEKGGVRDGGGKTDKCIV